MSRYFTSDLHIRHDVAVIHRGFVNEDGSADHDGHEIVLALNWDAVVHESDTVYILGDIAMNPNKGAFDFIDARPGRKILISGNHDATASFHSKASAAQRKWLDHFESIHDFLQIKIDGQKVLLSHYPYQGEGERNIDDRHTQFRLRDEGMPLLHGHTHSRYITSHNPNQFHVGLDAWDTGLVSEQDVVRWLAGR